MKRLLPYLILFTSIILASCAAYYSISGLSKLYAGASMAVIIMGCAIEFAKLIAASALNQFKDKLNFWIKFYLIVAIVIAMTITSAGIYGFLTNAYQQTSNSLELLNGEISVLNSKKESFKLSAGNLEKQIKSKNDRINQLSNIRTNQEIRLDSLYSRRSYVAAKRTEQIIVDADNQIKRMLVESDSLTKNIQSIQDSISTVELKVLELNSSSVIANEIGPLKYLGELTGIELNKIINWFTIFLVIIFDPLAIVLIVAYNKIVFKELGSTLKDDRVSNNKKSDDNTSYDELTSRRFGISSSDNSNVQTTGYMAPIVTGSSNIEIKSQSQSYSHLNIDNNDHLNEDFEYIPQNDDNPDASAPNIELTKSTPASSNNQPQRIG